jgi:hypothetical protein
MLLSYFSNYTLYKGDLTIEYKKKNHRINSGFNAKVENISIPLYKTLCTLWFKNKLRAYLNISICLKFLLNLNS